jgi:thiol:disulfide interchange protein
MTRHLISILASIALVGWATLASARPPELAEAWNGAEINWRDIKSGIREASQSGRPVIMVFHAPWCSSCKRYREIFKDSGIVEASRDFVMILIDADADKYANGAFAPDGTYVPRTIFLTAEGEIRTDLTGKTDPEHPHTIDIDNPGELLDLMKKARPGAPPSAPADRADIPR